MYSTPTIVNNTALHIRVDLKSAHQEIIKILSLKKKKRSYLTCNGNVFQLRNIEMKRLTK